jgi:sulfite reductase (NADPH) flavoprotein alpha-component
VDLSQLHYGLLALGDRKYRNFCGFGKHLDEWLQARGAQPLFKRIEVNNGDPAALQQWRHSLSHVAGTADLPDWQGAPFEAWTLQARRHLNAGSLGGPVYHLELTPPEGASRWEAGDLLQIEVPTDPGRPREYSIASLPADGAVHLLVRLERHDDGSHGLASGWLTQELQEGQTVRARLRVHANFRPGNNGERDLILIGNGTGLAGLRAHLRQRAATRAATGAGGPRLWLIFGERQAAHDVYYGDELRRWQEDGLLTHVDLVYSRDGDADRYVQDRLRRQSARLSDWVTAGAAIYVCGSLEGMAAGVNAVLQDTLGDRLAELQRQERYRRDVY